MPEPVVDLRSDTVTKPSKAMREAMASAEVGDDVYGEDPTVNRLEAAVAERFGFADALFTPTGVMANQIALRLLVAPGEELICDADAHIVAHEDGAAAWHGGIQTRTIVSDRGLLDPYVLAANIRHRAPYTVGTEAIEVEQTHNRGGGSVYPLETLQAISKTAREHDIALHCDGARIWHAHVADGVELNEYGTLFDSVSVCLSKGLGAPAGSVLLLDAGRKAEARVMRHRMGGGMRQAGILAAGGLYALENNIERLATDHENAKLIADRLGDADCQVRHPETNIVLVDTDDAAGVATKCAAEGVLVAPFGPSVLRIVTHLDADKPACERAAAVLATALAASSES